jgi:molybdenum cofactor biosynthesis enzyme
MASSSMPYLYASLIPAMTTVRAFSTSQPLAEPKWKKRHRRKAEIENMPGFTMMGSRPDTIRDRSIMIKWKTSVKGVLPPSLEEVGQKYNLRGTTFDGYWYRVADVKLADTEAKRKEAHYKAQKKLSQTSGNQGLKHLDLMQEAQEFADRDWESGEWRNWRPPRPTTEEGGTVAQQKTEESEKTTSADATQKDLEQQHEMGESGPLMPGADAAQKDAEQQQEMESPNEQASDAITTQQTAPEQSLQNTPDLTAFLEEVNVPQQSDRRIKKIEEKIRELKRRIAHIAGRKQWVPIPTSTESLTKSGELLTSRAAWRAKKKVAVLEEKFETKRAQELDELNSQILVHKEEIDAILQQNQLLDDVRRRKQEMLEKKRALLKQLHESPTLDKTAESTATNVSSGNDSSDIDSILEEALKNKKQSQKPKTTKPPPQLVRETPPLVRRLGVPHIHILEQSTTEAKDVISTKEEALTDPIMDRENSRTPPESADPISPRWPTLKDTSQSTPAQDALQSSRAAQRRPSDNLRLNVSPAGFIPIDADLIVSLEGSIPKLQDQVYEMQKRLKASYPRIDNLPYPVWKSNNQRTLQTWLKILVSKWQTRFADAGQNGHVETDIVDENVQAVLDQMVRDHDLGNEAAERMAMRWHEVFDQRGAMTGDAEGVLDWDEFQAGGMGFLGNESEAFESSPQENEAKAIPLTEKPAAQSTNQTSTYGSISRRSYSTSTRPPRGPAPTSVEETTNEARPVSEATAAPALPHLTASGSAHMVSVSAKAHTSRTAIAIGTIYFSNPTPLSLIRSNTLKKGDVLGVSRIAGIMASKKCPDIVPLCHPIMLTHVGVELKPFGPPSNSSSEKERRDDSSEAIDSDDLGFGGVMIEAKVQCEGQTGVEMEAMTAVMGAALSVVDMCKAVDKFQRIGGVRVVVKEGGKSGVWREEGWRSWQV